MLGSLWKLGCWIPPDQFCPRQKLLPDTLLRTVKSIQRGDFPTRRAAAARAAPSTPRLVSAARVGPVVYGLLLTFRGGGYG